MESLTYDGTQNRLPVHPISWAGLSGAVADRAFCGVMASAPGGRSAFYSGFVLLILA
jgi:hypothetical protein